LCEVIKIQQSATDEERSDKTKALTVLLQAGANVEARTFESRSLLNIAVGLYEFYPQDMTATRLLLEYGALIDEEVWPLLPSELQEQYSHQRKLTRNILKNWVVST
jgi:hypothetical protein